MRKMISNRRVKIAETNLMVITENSISLNVNSENIKNATTSEIKDYYDAEEFDSNDVYHIAKGTTKENELFDYANIPDYYKTSKNTYETEKDDFELGI